MDDVLGRVVAVSGSQMRADVTADQLTEASIRIGSMIKVRSGRGSHPIPSRRILSSHSGRSR